MDRNSFNKRKWKFEGTSERKGEVFEEKRILTKFLQNESAETEETKESLYSLTGVKRDTRIGTNGEKEIIHDLANP